MSLCLGTLSREKSIAVNVGARDQTLLVNDTAHDISVNLKMTRNARLWPARPIEVTELSQVSESESSRHQRKFFYLTNN